MSDDANPFLLPPPAPPDRPTALRVILLLSAVAHVVLLALFWRAPAEPAPHPSAGDSVRVLRGQVTDGAGEPGLRLTGYAEVPAPKR